MAIVDVHTSSSVTCGAEVCLLKEAVFLPRAGTRGFVGHGECIVAEAFWAVRDDCQRAFTGICSLA